MFALVNSSFCYAQPDAADAQKDQGWTNVTEMVAQIENGQALTNVYVGLIRWDYGVETQAKIGEYTPANDSEKAQVQQIARQNANALYDLYQNCQKTIATTKFDAPTTDILNEWRSDAENLLKRLRSQGLLSPAEQTASLK